MTFQHEQTKPSATGAQTGPSITKGIQYHICLTSDAFTRKDRPEGRSEDGCTQEALRSLSEAGWCAGRVCSGTLNLADKVTMSKCTPLPGDNTGKHQGVAGANSNPSPPREARRGSTRSAWLRKKGPSRRGNMVNSWLERCPAALTRSTAGTKVEITRDSHRRRGPAYPDRQPPARNTVTPYLSRYGEQGQPGRGMGAGRTTKRTPSGNRRDLQNSFGTDGILWKGGNA